MKREVVIDATPVPVWDCEACVFESPRSIHSILECIHDQRSPIRDRAFWWLADFGPTALAKADEIIPPLARHRELFAEALADQDSDVRRIAAYSVVGCIKASDLHELSPNHLSILSTSIRLLKPDREGYGGIRIALQRLSRYLHSPRVPDQVRSYLAEVM